MKVTYDTGSEEAMSYVLRTIAHGAPERVALKRAERKFGITRDYLRSLMRLAREDS